MDQMIPVTHVHPHVQWSGTASLIPPEPWVQRAACAEVDPDLFFPGVGVRTAAKAKVVCRSCPVIGDCLDYALREFQEEGIWGGTSREERLKLRKEARA